MYTCNSCQKTFKYNSKLLEHAPQGGVPNCVKGALSIEIGEAQLFCWVCDIKFTRQDSLIAHLGTKKHVIVSWF